MWRISAAVAITACVKEVEKVDPRTGCEVCHRPRPEPGADPAGIEDAHPYGDIALACTDCHGGNAGTYKQSEAHVPARDGRAFIRNLTAGQLDRIDPAYLRFVNPADLRVANTGCGAASPAAGGTGCHQPRIDDIRVSMMGHTAGEVVVARYRAGLQDDPLGHVGATSLFDPDFDPSLPSTVERMDRFDPSPPELSMLDVLASTTAAAGDAANRLYGEIQDDYMVKSCFRCHLWDFGENSFRGDFRSSGCAACHMPYSDDGTSQSADPRIPKEVSPHPIRHELTTRIPTEQCTHCHYRGGRIGPSFLGYRESGGSGYNPEKPDSLGVALHGHDAAYYLTDENTDNNIDETPADVHFERGLHCIDCHRSGDVHGDGHIYSDTQVPVRIECEDCHGTIERETSGMDSAGAVIEGLERDGDGNVWLVGRIDGARHPVTQIARSVDPASPTFSVLAAESMGRSGGFSHTDRLECYTCHSAWYPSCYGCHVTMDYSKTSRLLTTGETRAGKPSGGRLWVVVDDLVLMWNTEGKIAPSMPSERFLLSVKDGEGDLVVDRRMRSRAGDQGRPTFGQRTFNPHTIQKRSAFSVCERCHVAEDRSNLERVRQTVGLGTDRYLLADDLGRTFRLDAIVGDGGESVVLVGHPAPEESRPLELELRTQLLEEPVR